MGMNNNGMGINNNAMGINNNGMGMNNNGMGLNNNGMGLNNNGMGMNNMNMNFNQNFNNPLMMNMMMQNMQNMQNMMNFQNMQNMQNAMMNSLQNMQQQINPQNNPVNPAPSPTQSQSNSKFINLFFRISENQNDTNAAKNDKANLISIQCTLDDKLSDIVEKYRTSSHNVPAIWSSSLKWTLMFKSGTIILSGVTSDLGYFFIVTFTIFNFIHLRL